MLPRLRVTLVLCRMRNGMLRAPWAIGGHIHQRLNQYEAYLTIKAVDGQWKITNLEMLKEQRL